MRKYFLAAATFIFVAYLAGIAFLYVEQRHLEYHFSPQHADIQAAGIANLQERIITTTDGEHLIVWHVPPRLNKPVLLYFPGNNDNLSHPGRRLAFRNLTADGTGLLALSYRGEGGSSGSPTESGLHLDALALYEEGVHLYGADRLVAMGHSLGTGVASWLATEKKVRALILEAPYTSTAAIAQMRYWYAPINLLMTDQFHTDRIISQLKVPVLILHGDHDSVIPLNEGKKLYELAPSPKRLVIFNGAGHENLQHYGATGQIQDFLGLAESRKLDNSQVLIVPEA
jgi:pimeloyl-ACP methyl ester carboxylesterase